MISPLIFNALKDLVLNPDGVTARVFPGEAPANVGRPYIVYTRAGGKSFDDLDGATAASGVKNVRVQITVWSDDYLVAEQLIDNAGDALTGPPLSGVSIGVEPVYERDQETKLHGFRQDFSIYYTP